MVDLVETVDEVIQNIRDFHKLYVDKKIPNDKVKNRLNFAAYKKDGIYLFCPIDSAVCKNPPHLDPNARDISKKRVTEILGEPYIHGGRGYNKQESPSCEEIYNFYEVYCGNLGTSPNKYGANPNIKYTKVRRFWLIDSDVPRAHSIQPTTHPTQQATPKHCCKILKAYTLIQRLVRQLVRR